MASSAAVLSIPPRRMIEPLPNCFSICDTARSRARDFSVRSAAIGSFRLRMVYSFCPLRTGLAFQQEQFFTDESVELVRAGRILGKTAYAFAIAGLPRIQGLRRFKTFLGFSQPVHFQAQQSELVISFTELRIQSC